MRMIILKKEENIDEETIYFADWISKKDTQYELKSILPLSVNELIVKTAAREMIEDAFSLELSTDERKNNVLVNALFNLEVSKRIFVEIEQKKSIAQERYDDLVKLSHKSLYSENEDAMAVIQGDINSSKQGLEEINTLVTHFAEPLENKEKIASFKKGEIWYEGKESKEWDNKAKALNFIDGASDNQTDINVSAKALLDRIDVLVVRIDGLFNAHSLNANMEQGEEISEENKVIEDKLIEEGVEPEDIDSSTVLSFMGTEETPKDEEKVEDKQVSTDTPKETASLGKDEVISDDISGVSTGFSSMFEEMGQGETTALKDTIVSAEVQEKILAKEVDPKDNPLLDIAPSEHEENELDTSSKQSF